MLQFIPMLISGGLGLVKDHFKQKQEEKQAVHERKLTKIKQDADWDTIQAQNSGNSWKDEYLAIILTSPFIAMFLAVVFGAEEMVQRFKVAFQVLDTEVPDEYWYLLAVVVASSFGVKKVIDFINAKRG